MVCVSAKRHLYSMLLSDRLKSSRNLSSCHQSRSLVRWYRYSLTLQRPFSRSPWKEKSRYCLVSEHHFALSDTPSRWDLEYQRPQDPQIRCVSYYLGQKKGRHCDSGWHKILLIRI